MSVRRLTQAFEQNDKKAASPPVSPQRAKVAKPPLRINTLSSEGGAEASLASVAAQAAAVSASRLKSPPTALFTPNSAHTFGRPPISLALAGPSTSSDRADKPKPELASLTESPSDLAAASTPMSSLPTPPATADLAARRAQRYSRDEQQLAAAANPDLPAFSPETLQKFELARAQKTLEERAATARARVVELREKLSKGGLEPKEHTALQQERWRQERWADAAEQELVRMNEAAAAPKDLDARLSHPMSAMTGENAIPLSAATMDAEKRKANLAKFFARSPTHLTAHARRRSSVVLITSSPHDARSPTLQLQLRDWPLGAELRRHNNAAIRPRSLDGKTRNTTPAVVRLGHGSARKKSLRTPPALPLFDEEAGGATGDTQASADWVHSAPAHTALFPNELGPVHVEPAFDEHMREGSAKIYSHFKPRTREEILASAGPDTGTLKMPSYVATLLDDFDLGAPDVATDLTLPEPVPIPLRAAKSYRSSSSTAATTRVSSLAADAPQIPPAKPLPLLTLTLTRRASVDTLGSAVLVARPSVDSYHYSPAPRTSRLRLAQSFRSSTYSGEGTSSALGVGGSEESGGGRMRKLSFLRPRTVTETGDEEGVRVIDRVRKRVGILGKR